MGPVEGTNGQQFIHQLIHQGHVFSPADFYVTPQRREQDNTHHAMLVVKLFGSTSALMQGKTFEELRLI